jgi:hypothetical protein
MTKGHKIWEWGYNEDTNKVYCIKGMVMDVYKPSLVRNYANQPNCWTCLRIDVPLVDQGEIFSMKDVALAVKSIVLHSPWPLSQATPATFWEVIRGWGNTWMWDNLSIMGDLNWIAVSIADNSCVAVTDGLYMKELYPHLNSAAFVLECSKGRGRLVGSIVEHTPNAGSYRGELLGLMAIHLILWGVNEVCQGLQGSAHILSDCLGALNKVKNLPPYCIPTQCSHSDILKNILVNCSNLSFTQIFSHVKAHQYNHTGYESLTRSLQLNCQMDYHAKKAIWDTNHNPDAPT